MELLKIICNALDDVKALDIVALNMKGISPLFDYMVIASSTNTRQTQGLIQNVKSEVTKAGYDIRGIEGDDGLWTLIDCKDIIVNVFTQEARNHYALEKLYLDVEKINVIELLNQ